MTVRVIVYARVSTDMQAEGGLSIAAQLNEMKEFVARRQDWKIVAEMVDPGYSGSSLKRPGLEALLSAVEEKSCDVVLVHEMSRLSRSIFDSFRIFETLGEQGVGFASVKDPDFDFSTPQGRFFLTMISAMNQYYLDLLKQHTAKGKRERARQGIYNASITPYGYKHAGDSRTAPVIVPEEEPAIRLAFESYAPGNMSYQDIADRLNEAGYRTRSGARFSKDTIDDMLRNHFYAGKIVYGTKRKGQAPEIFNGNHQAIISMELFEACEQVRAKRRGTARSYHYQYKVYLLNAISVCSLCGRTLRAQGTSANRYYREMSRSRGYVDCPNAQKGVIAEVVEAQVEAIFRQLRLPPDWQAEVEALLDRETETEALNNRRARLEAEKRRLRQLYIKGEFQDDEEAYDLERNRIQRELDALPTGDLASLDEAAGMLEQLADVWDEADLTTKRDLLRLVLRQVEIDVQQGRVMSISPYPVFLPLFRQAEYLYEIDLGRFVPRWSSEQTEQMGPVTVLDPVTGTQTLTSGRAPDWPLVLSLPAVPDKQRITPALSDCLTAYRKAEQPVHRIIEVPHPAYPPLRLDERKWPGLVITKAPAGQVEQVAAPGSISFLYTPFRLQEQDQPDTWLAEMVSLLEPGGYWTLVEVMPASMPGHWLYQFFPEAWELEKKRSLNPTGLYQLLQQHGLTVTLTQTTYYQAVSYQAAVTIAGQRVASSLLAGLPDENYREGFTRLQEACAERGADTLIPSYFCLAEAVAQRPWPNKKSSQRGRK